MVWISKFKCNS